MRSKRAFRFVDNSQKRLFTTNTVDSKHFTKNFKKKVLRRFSRVGSMSLEYVQAKTDQVAHHVTYSTKFLETQKREGLDMC